MSRAHGRRAQLAAAILIRRLDELVVKTADELSL